MTKESKHNFADFIFKLKLWFLVTAYEIAGSIFGIGIPPLPSVAAIIDKGDKVLAIELTYKKGLALPGGALKGDENFEQALEREIKEETGLRVTNVEYFGSYSSYSSSKRHPKVSVVYTVLVKGKPKPSVEGKPVWVNPKNALKDFYYEDNTRALKDYLDKK